MSRTTLLLALALVVCAAPGCRVDPVSVSPIVLPAPSAGIVTPAAPPIRAVTARARGGTLEFVAIYDRAFLGTMPAFDPGQPGGWCFQLFIDADQAPTGYGRGYDYLVRAIERAPGGGFHLVRAEPGEGPGGWGEIVGEVAVRLVDQRLSLTIPLDLLGPDEGRLGFVLELYATLSDGAGGVTHAFVANYSGSTSPSPFAPLLGDRPIALHADRR